MIADARHKSSADISNRFSHRRKINNKNYTFGNGTKEDYDKLYKDEDRARQPMRTAADYRAREKFYSTSNDAEDAEVNRINKERAFSKRPVLGAIARANNKRLDQEYRKKNDGTRRCTNDDTYGKGDLSSAISKRNDKKRKAVKEACEYILSILDDEE